MPHPLHHHTRRLMLVPSLAALLAGGSFATAEDAVPAPAPAPTTTSKDTVTVVGDRERDGYKVEEGSSLLRTPQPLKDTPQTIQVLPKELLRANGSATLQDAMRSVSGAALGSGEGSSTGDRIYLRGFLVNTDIYTDGMHDPALYLRDTFNADSIEVLKGPSSVLVGRGSPGGAINIITNKPTDFWTGDAAVTENSYGATRAVVGAGGPLVKDGLLDFRLDGMAQGGDTFRDDVSYKRYGLAPSLATHLGQFDILLQAFWQKEDSTYDSGMATYRGRPTDVDVSKFYGFKDDDYQKYTIASYTLGVNYRFNEQWTARNQTRYYNDDRDLRATTLQTPANAAQQINMNRSQTLRDNRLKGFDNVTEAQYTGLLFGRPFSATGGFEYVYETSDNRGKNSTAVPAIAVFDPDSSPTTVGAGRANDLSGVLNTDSLGTARTGGAYAFLTWEFLKDLTAVVGARVDNYHAEFDDRTAANIDESLTDHYFTTHDGLVYAITPQVSAYASYATAVNPSAENLALTATTVALNPERTRAYEIGLKAESRDKDIGANVAVFRTDKYDQRTGTAPAPTTIDGETRIDGIDLGVSGKPVERVSVYGGVTFMKGEVLNSNSVGTSNVDPTIINVPVQGNEPIGTPRATGNLWVNVDLSHGFSAGAGMYAVARRYGDAINTTVIPGYARYDAAVKYEHDFNGYKGFLQLNVFNLTDVTYYDGDRNRFVTPGAPFSGQLTAGATF